MYPSRQQTSLTGPLFSKEGQDINALARLKTTLLRSNKLTT